MKARNISTLAWAISIIAACQMEEPALVRFNPDEVTFYAGNGDLSTTRTILQADGSINWLPQDAIKVFYGQNQSARFVSDNTESAGTVAFKGALKDFSYTEGTSFQAVYPYREDSRFNGNTLRVTIPSEQEAIAGTFADDLLVSVARTDSFTLMFYNVCGGIKFCLTEPGVTSVQFSGNADEPLAGTVEVGWADDGHPEVEAFVTPATAITLTPPDDGTFSTGEWYYLAALPVTLQSGYKFTLTKADGTSTIRKNEASVTLRRAVLGILQDMDKGLEYIVRVPDNEVWYTTTDDAPLPIDQDLFEQYGLVNHTYESGKGRLVFSSPLRYTNGIFSGLTTLASICLPESVTEILVRSFYGDTALSHVDMPGVKLIECEAFCYTNFTGTLALPEGLEELGWAFIEGCDGIEEVILPATLKRFNGGNIFNGKGLKKIIMKSLTPPQQMLTYNQGEKVYFFEWVSRDMLFANKCMICVPEESLSSYQNDPCWETIAPYLTVEGKTPDECWYTSTDYSRDGEVRYLQEATVGKGIDLIFMGDGYVDRDLEPGGKFEQRVVLEMETLFSYEPYRTFRDRFNIVIINCVSKHDVYFNPFGPERLFTYDEYDKPSYWYFGANYDTCWEYAMKVTRPAGEPIFATVLMNKNYDGEQAFCSRDSEGTAFAFCSNRRNDSDIHVNEETVPHEMGGHGFGLLSDEYGGVGTHFPEYMRASMDQEFLETGAGANLDWRNDPDQVRWSRFLKDTRYSEEGLGVWEGGGGRYEFGVYRASEESVMNGVGSHSWAWWHPTWFNAPSREQIYKQIMKYSEGDGWVYDYETFVELDAPGRQQAAERYQQYLSLCQEWYEP